MDDLLKEAIADAKAVRETALENAKMALEEAFTPRLQNMLSQKIQSEIEDEDIDLDSSVTVFETTIDSFCTNIDLGNVILKTYITGKGKIGAVEIKVQNGTDNEESKKGLIKGYAESNFGNLDMESELWNGYKIWDIGSKQIYYYAYEKNNQPTEEGIVVTSKRYYDVLLHDQYE